MITEIGDKLQTVSAVVNRDDWKKLQLIAEREERSTSYILREAISLYLFMARKDRKEVT